MKVALVCDWLTEIGGAEDVLMEFHKMFPDAPIYTSQYRKGRIAWFKDAEVKTGWLQYFPIWSRRLIAPLRQKYFENLDLNGYDLVISITGCDAKFIKTTGKHICFCHAATQYYWGKYDEYLKNPGFGILNPLARLVFKRVSPKLRKKDFDASENPDEYITVSNFTKKEIKRFYKREAKVVNPPVNVGVFAQAVDNYNTKKGKSQTKISHNKTIKMQISQAIKNEQKFCTDLKNVENLDVLAKIFAKYEDGFYLNFSRQVNWKRLDLIVKCCKKLNLPLVLIGNGPENKRLKKFAKGASNISFFDHLPKSDLAVISSFAKAFIFPSEEPFGIAPVEAMSAGCPVIAYKGGGALDYIKDGKNGVFFEKQDEKSLEKCLKKFDKGDISLDSPKKISDSVKKCSSDNFEKNIKKIASKTITKKSQTKKKPAKNFKRLMILCLPLVLFFSFFPNLKFGENSSMHFELSLPLLWLAVFSVMSLKTATKYVKTHLKTPLLALPIAAVLSFVHTTNPVRGLFTLAILSCIFISIIGINEDLKSEKLPKDFKGAIIAESITICLFCIAQAVFDALGVKNNLTLLCDNCTSGIFSFPRPNGFTIEPQFMGSLLIAPFFLTLNSILENKNGKSQVKLFMCTLIIGATIVLTLSRGSIFALLLSCAALILLLRSFKKSLIILAIGLFSTITAVLTQGTLAVIGPTDVSFTDAVSTSVSQLTLGKIDLNSQKTNHNVEFPEPPINQVSPKFSGYVEESTNRRVQLINFAAKITFENPTNTVFGTGLGSAGTEMYVHFPEEQGHEKEIVQNEYFEALLETGLIGLGMLALTIVTFLKIEQFKFEPYTFATVVAFMITIFFFSGFPNALHVYLLPVLWYNLLYDKNSLSRIQK